MIDPTLTTLIAEMQRAQQAHAGTYFGSVIQGWLDTLARSVLSSSEFSSIPTPDAERLRASFLVRWPGRGKADQPCGEFVSANPGLSTHSPDPCCRCGWSRADDQRDEAPSVPSSQDWEPIESAPKDGTWFLGWNSDVGWFVWRAGTDLMAGENPEPTHWMPLPAPPTAALHSQPPAPDLRTAIEAQTRAAVFREIHDHWEFTTTDEASFDEWLHEGIRDADLKVTDALKAREER